MEGHPGEREPARPVARLQHEDSGNDGEDAEHGDPDEFIHRWTVAMKRGKVRSSRAYAYGDVEQAENRYCDRALHCLQRKYTLWELCGRRCLCVCLGLRVADGV